jgi:hypothetical protein
MEAKPLLYTYWLIVRERERERESYVSALAGIFQTRGAAPGKRRSRQGLERALPPIK